LELQNVGQQRRFSVNRTVRNFAKKGDRERRFWVHDVITRRRQYGEYHRPIQELRLDGDRFRRQFRMSPAVFHELFTAIGPCLSRSNTNWRQAIDPGQRLAVSNIEVIITCLLRTGLLLSIVFCRFVVV